MSWAERAADRSPVVQRSRTRGVEHAKAIVEAAQRLMAVKGASFTTQELVKEAGIALKTFYRYFPSKDHLMLAVIENSIEESCVSYREQARSRRDPVARLHFYVTSIMGSLKGRPGAASPRFITTEHWRLQPLYPEELARATRPVTELLLAEIRSAQEKGLLKPTDPEHDAWLINQLLMAVYHHHAYAATEEPADLIGERLWAFCLAALGGTPAADLPRRSKTGK
jgi:AcrR family transcriptional regulator